MPRVVVVGRDASLWMAVLAVQRALGSAGVAVTALEVPTLLEPDDAYATVPSLATLHELLGFDEAILAARCMGVPLVAQRFSNWARGRHSFVHGYDAPAEEGDVDFTQYWLKARARGLRVPYEDFSLAAAAAKQGRVPLARISGAGLAAGAAYQVNAERYAGLLKHYALRRDVEHRTGRVADVEIADGRIVAVTWEGGDRVEGDLFVDASGSEAILIGRMPDTGWESWSEWLPCTAMLTASGPPLEPLPAFAQLSAFRAGWVRIEPLQDRTVITACVGTDYADDEMLQNLGVLAGVRIEGEALLDMLDPGVRRRAWVGNCVAIGAAAVRLEPTYPVDLHMDHFCTAQMLGLFAPASAGMPAADVYNGALAAHAANLRDFQAAHYRLNRRIDDPFWDRAREANLPQSLEEKISAFAATGRVPVNPNEALQADDWASVFIGHGHVPDAYDPQVDALSDEELMASVRQRLRDIATLVNQMPTVDQFIEMAKQPGARGS